MFSHPPYQRKWSDIKSDINSGHQTLYEWDSGRKWPIEGIVIPILGFILMVNSYYLSTLTQYNCNVQGIKIDQSISGGLHTQQIESRFAAT